MKIILGIILGSLFGFALYYSGAANSNKLKNMLTLKNLTIMKIIVFGIGFAALLVSITGMLGILDISHFSVKTTHLGVVLGGLIFGIGFGWAGTCPGTCVAASGVGFKKGISTIIGGLLGAFIFSLSYGFFKEIGLFSAFNFGKLTLFKISEKYPSVLEIGFGGLLLLGLLFMGVAVLLPIMPGSKEELN